jgi:aerobic-type carbon monoxide dehydrogenase small subunit (CoxS/CutS family)
MLVRLCRWVSLEKSTNICLSVNGTIHELDLDPEMPLLWALRDTIGLTGTKYARGGPREGTQATLETGLRKSS